jgi:hypothetical protein
VETDRKFVWSSRAGCPCHWKGIDSVYLLRSASGSALARLARRKEFLIS